MQKLHLLEKTSKDDLGKENHELVHDNEREDEDQLKITEKKAGTSSPLPREDVEDEKVTTRMGRVIKKPARYRNER
jgi:hypothetical protein